MSNRDYYELIDEIMETVYANNSLKIIEAVAPASEKESVVKKTFYSFSHQVDMNTNVKE